MTTVVDTLQSQVDQENISIGNYLLARLVQLNATVRTKYSTGSSYLCSTICTVNVRFAR